MKSFITIISGFAFVTVTQAASCSLLNAEPVTVNTGSNGGGNSGSGGTSGGGGGGVPNLYSCIDMETYENHCEIQYRRFMSKRSLLAVSKRDELYCTSTEACISLDSEAICYNPKTDDFHITDGSKGNFRTGDYLLPDGQSGNMFNGPIPTPYSLTDARAPQATIRTSKAPSSTKSVSTIDAADATISSPLADSTMRSSSDPTNTSPTSATTTPNLGNQKRGHGNLVGAAIGILGLLAL